MSRVAFSKMHGIGNDFVMIDAVAQPFEFDAATVAERVCDRRFGVGSDGLILAERDDSGALWMRMWNPDGSESEMCGNGVRCFALFARDRGIVDSDRIPVMTGAGELTLDVLDGDRVRVDMGTARLTRGEIGMVGDAAERFVDAPLSGTLWKGTAVSMGNPHVVVFVDDVAAVDLNVEGPRLETHELFPNRVNAHFVQVEPDRLVQRTWERGAGATLACGTGACASAVAAKLARGVDTPIDVRLPGGTLTIEIDEDFRVFMTGPAARVFDGELSLD